MNEEEAREIIDNMSEQELNDFIFFALKEVEKENQKLKTELRNKDKEIQFQKEINKTEQDRHKQTEKSLKGQLEKKDKQIEQYQNMLATNDMLHVLECEKKDKIINKIQEEVLDHIGFENRLKRDNREPDLFNQGRFYVANNINNILKGK